jgi:hypothetical protein
MPKYFPIFEGIGSPFRIGKLSEEPSAVRRQLSCPVESSRPKDLPLQALTDPYVRLSPHTALLIHRLLNIQNPNVQITLVGFLDSA